MKIRPDLSTLLRLDPDALYVALDRRRRRQRLSWRAVYQRGDQEWATSLVTHVQLDSDRFGPREAS